MHLLHVETEDDIRIRPVCPLKLKLDSGLYHKKSKELWKGSVEEWSNTHLLYDTAVLGGKNRKQKVKQHDCVVDSYQSSNKFGITPVQINILKSWYLTGEKFHYSFHCDSHMFLPPFYREFHEALPWACEICCSEKEFHQNSPEFCVQEPHLLLASVWFLLPIVFIPMVPIYKVKAIVSPWCCPGCWPTHGTIQGTDSFSCAVEDADSFPCTTQGIKSSTFLYRLFILIIFPLLAKPLRPKATWVEKGLFHLAHPSFRKFRVRTQAGEEYDGKN